MPTTLLVLPRPSRFDHANATILAGPARRLVDETLGEGSYDVCYAADYRRDDPRYTEIILVASSC